MMAPIRFYSVKSISALLYALLLALGFSAEAHAQVTAIHGIVTGHDQQVGFRAAIMKQAIKYNLAREARNDPNEIVDFTLQGDKQRINAALDAIRQGTPKSSNIEVATTSTTVNPDLHTFTIVDWTSSSRRITNKYMLVFDLRTQDTELTPKDVKAKWRQILERTLGPEDLKKLLPGD